MHSRPSTTDEREKILKETHYNVQMLPGELVSFDFLTDSLQHQHLSKPPFQSQGLSLSQSHRTLRALVDELFGFPFALPLAQGRMAEALISRLLVKPGSVIPTNMAFPTTRLHQELLGGQSLEMICEEALNPSSPFPFKGNLDTKKLSDFLQTHSAKTPYLSLETCVNAIGGQPFSLKNLKEVSAIARRYKMPLYLDACRIFENAYHIQAKEPEYSNLGIKEIIREICSLADGMTLSLAKDFPTPIGAVAAFRNQELYEHAFDFIFAMGDGLCGETLEIMTHALKTVQRDTELIKKRMELTAMFHEGLAAAGYPVFQPAGGHCVLLDLDKLLPHLKPEQFKAEAVNCALYRSFGLRGAPHMPSPSQKDKSFFRMALPLLNYDDGQIKKLIRLMKDWLPQCREVKGLTMTYLPKGLSGSFRARFAPIET